MYTETKYRKLKISRSSIKNTFKMYEQCKRVKLQKKPHWSTRSQKGSQLAVYKMMINKIMIMMIMIVK